MTTSFVCWTMYLFGSLAEISNSESIHIPNDFPVSKMQTSLAFTDSGGESDHSEGGGTTVGKFQINDLIVTNIVIALVNTFAVRPIFKGFRDVFDVRKTINNSFNRPFGVTMRNFIEINYENEIESIVFNAKKEGRETYSS